MQVEIYALDSAVCYERYLESMRRSLNKIYDAEW